MAVWAVLSAYVLVTSLALADARTDALIRYLQMSTNARVRAQAALALGRQPPSSSIETALNRAMQDPEPIVRSACEAALQTLAAARARGIHAEGEPVLVATASKQEGTVSARRAAFYVQIGMPSSQARGLEASVLLSLRDEVMQQVRGFDGVRIAPAREDRSTAYDVLRASGMAGYFLDPIVNKLEHGPGGTLSAQVSIVVATYPDRSIKGMLTGKATTTRRGRDDEAALMVTRAAFSSALKTLPQAFAASYAERMRAAR